MVAFSLIKTLLMSRALHKSVLTIIIVAVGADQVIKYTDNKAAEESARLMEQARLVEKRLDRKDLHDDERHRAVMAMMQDFNSSLKVMDTRLYDLWKAQKAEQAKRLNEGGLSVFSRQTHPPR